MKLWGRVIKNTKIQQDAIVDYPDMLPSQVTDWDATIGELCQKLNLSRPVILIKNIADLQVFSHTTFKASDFMESVTFDRFVISVLL